MRVNGKFIASRLVIGLVGILVLVFGAIWINTHQTRADAINATDFVFTVDTIKAGGATTATLCQMLANS